MQIDIDARLIQETNACLPQHSCHAVIHVGLRKSYFEAKRVGNTVSQRFNVPASLSMIYRLGGGYTATVADNDERQELYSDIQRRDKER